MKAMCGKMIPSDSCSWRFDKFDYQAVEFNWHYHTEYEICLTLNSNGAKHIGDHVDYYCRPDLVLLGPNLPHSWHCKLDDENKPITIYVAQIPAHWLDNLVASHSEFKVFKNILKLSLRGIEFGQAITAESVAIFKAMVKAEPIEKFILLIQLLHLMVKDDEARVLSSSYFTFGDKTDISVDKLDKVINYIYQNYTEPLCAEELASLVHMSTNHFHRIFKERTEQTLNQFINRLRIGKACKMLLNTNALISTISDQCGFNNISNFNRRFRMMKGVTPKEFRRSIKAPSPL
ncbi:helix-turn-helix transcriptional regulator [Catenovulum sp. SM1970]|uniref:AraC family transcriptional regulator n=1 Tax=Marinifaba aquimaris TaxID=2741323 RepID=UPI001572BB1A|nr:AraC family transcriptional regulator [Marinifaba aquimaris]NTS76028.1 helix-turn-helix transcriptional regulator [Marinifaba aquimaris]